MKNRLNKSVVNNNDDSGTTMDGVSNMSDAMLVLAVGIMLALVIKEYIKKRKQDKEDAEMFV